jgi:nucleotide-binding universal stress UspA family protein
MRVLLAMDGSNDAKAAGQWLGHLPLPPDREVLVVTVVTPPILPVVPDVIGDLHRALVADARRLADNTASELLTARKATGRVVEGDPREEIIAAARTWGADLIVLGARGLGALTEFLLGSVSLGVARHAPCPVLVCKGAPRDVRSTTVALDGSAHARAALAWFAALPLPSVSRVRLLAVTEPQRYPSSAPGVLREALRSAVAAIEGERRAALEKECVAAVETLHGRDLVVELSVQAGKAADVIVRDSAANGSDLLVLGARGLGTLERLLLGSVSESVLRHASCPVLVVRPRPVAE